MTMSIIDFSTIDSIDWLWLAIGAAGVGMEKAGIKGMSMLVVPIYALTLGAFESSGLLLLLFLLADVFGMMYYYRSVEWKIVINLLIAATIGIGIGAWTGRHIDPATFQTILSLTILLCLLFLLWQAWFPSAVAVAQHPYFGWAMGILGGFSTMIANVSSPIMAVYLLSRNLPKNQFIATMVWFFFGINLIKLPVHLWFWQTIDYGILTHAFWAIPAIAIGFIIGLLVIKQINDKYFRYFIIMITLMAALKLLFS